MTKKPVEGICQLDGCTNPAPRISPRGPTPKWCSDYHRQLAYRERRIEARAQEIAAKRGKR